MPASEQQFECGVGCVIGRGAADKECVQTVTLSCGQDILLICPQAAHVCVCVGLKCQAKVTGLGPC